MVPVLVELEIEEMLVHLLHTRRCYAILCFAAVYYTYLLSFMVT